MLLTLKSVWRKERLISCNFCPEKSSSEASGVTFGTFAKELTEKIQQQGFDNLPFRKVELEKNFNVKIR